MGCFVKSVQRGTTAIAAAGTTISVTLPETVDTSRTIFFFTAKSTDSIQSIWDSAAQMSVDSSTQITFTRAGNTGTLSISWEYVQFTPDSDILVQHGSAIMGATSVQVNLGTTVDVTKSWIMISWQRNWVGMNESSFAKAKFTSSAGASITLESTASMGYAIANLNYQVIQCGDCSVQTLELSNVNATTVLQNISAVNKARTATFSSCKATAVQAFTEAMIYGIGVSDSTTVQYQKFGGAGNGFDITTFVVSYTSATVDQYTVLMDAATATVNTTITARSMGRSVINQSRCDSRLLSPTTASDSSGSYGLNQSILTTTTNITTSRAGAGVATGESVQVLSFTGGPFWWSAPVSYRRRYLTR